MGVKSYIKVLGLDTLRRRSRQDLARIGWSIVAVAAVATLIVATPGFLTRRPLGKLGVHLLFEPSPAMLLLHRLNLLGSFLSVVLSFVLAWILYRRSHANGMALFTAYYLVIHGLLFGGTVEMLEPRWTQAAAVNSFILLPAITFPLTITLFAIFPDGRFVPAWSKRLIPLSLTPFLFTATQFILSQADAGRDLIDTLVVLTYLVIICIVLFVIGAQIHRYRAVSTYVQKQQSKWVFFGFLTMVGLFVVASGPWEYVRTLPAGTVMPWWVPLVESCWILAVMVMPLTLTISILRYRLYDVDVLINRTLMYGALSSVIVVFYVLVVGGMGVVFQSRGNLIFSLVATGIVAVLFDPLRTRLQSGVNRLLYGDREDPFSVLRKLGQRLEGAGIPEDLLDVIVETLGHTLKLPYAEIVLFGFEDPVLLSKWGKWEKDLQAFPIYHQGSQIGCLNVALRSPDEPFSESDLRLIRQIGRQAGSIAYAVQLTRELRQSRARIVNTREQERRRLYRDLHDGLGPVLASQGLKVAAVRHLLEEEPGMALEILDGLAEQNEAAVAEIRRLVYALRPPELDELGLVEAIREYAAGLNFASQDATQFRVSAPQFESRRPSLPIEVEVAAYRIATEAITNVTRHANAKSCTISLYEEKKSIGDELCLEIVDDGIGIEGSDSVGVGLHSMRERTREIGGKLIIHSDAVRGTKVEVRFPVTGFE